MKFIIDRTKWLRGDREHSKLLRSSDGKMCCIGQVCKQLGVAMDQMSDRSRVDSMPVLFRPRIFQGTNEYDAAWVSCCYGNNDDEKISDETRESRIAK